MNIKIPPKFYALLPTLFLWFAGTTFAETMECPPLPEYSEKQCQETQFFERIEGPKEVRKINANFDQKLDLIFRDNIAHPTYATKEIIQDLIVYRQCFTKLCRNITTQCAGQNSLGNNVQQELDWCQGKRDEFFELQTAKTEYYVVQNTARKYRSLHEEKIARIGYRFYKYIHTSSMKNILKSLRYAAANITHLVRYPR